MLKFSALGAAALTLPLERVVRAKSASRLAASKLPKLYTRGSSCRGGRQGPGRGHRGGLLHHQAGAGPGTDPGRPDLEDQRVRLQRPGPRPHHPRSSGPPGRRSPHQQAAGDPPHARLRAVDLDSPARVGLAAPVRWLRQRHHEPRRVQGLPVPQRPGLAHALVPRPRRAPHRRERLHGPRRAVPPARRRRGRGCRSPRAAATAR